MEQNEVLARQFQEHGAHLRAVAYRMLGSLSEAEDAVQEAWLRLNRSDTSEVANLAGWLTTVVGRVCLDMLRTRRSRREEPIEHAPGAADPVDPEQEAVLADSVGLALLVVLDTLDPAERLAFVLHDLFAMPFTEIAEVVGRSPAATRQLASRARRRVRGTDTVPEADLSRQREVVEAFLAAARGGDLEALLVVLDPDVVVRGGAGGQTRGAEAVARGASAFAERARNSRLALVNGSVGLVVAPRGRLALALVFSITGNRIAEVEVISDRERLDGLRLAVLAG
ncbi:sigma-70 family RNA polymerase sigma factor [Kutzneria albida]|uniref:Uncharacterized protein n=1 Tax=Kutzneria albida DSM 43870 TaxID=1449976 RepID=W5WJG2_9PSEU|nr:sigma-70 family RNA polymerase sigma factor [Kutzneria albida]AHI00886.1 hypothetical protein KALB_7528 [Kutzneria albida DSM 43870]